MKIPTLVLWLCGRYIYLEWHPKLKHWGDNLQWENCKKCEFVPHIRVYALWIWYNGLPPTID